MSMVWLHLLNMLRFLLLLWNRETLRGWSHLIVLWILLPKISTLDDFNVVHITPNKCSSWGVFLWSKTVVSSTCISQIVFPHWDPRKVWISRRLVVVLVESLICVRWILINKLVWLRALKKHILISVPAQHLFLSLMLAHSLCDLTLLLL